MASSATSIWSSSSEEENGDDDAKDETQPGVLASMYGHDEQVDTDSYWKKGMVDNARSSDVAMVSYDWLKDSKPSTSEKCNVLVEAVTYSPQRHRRKIVDRIREFVRMLWQYHWLYHNSEPLLLTAILGKIRSGYSSYWGRIKTVVSLQKRVSSVVIMASSNGNIFRVIDRLCGEFIGHRWIPRTKASDAELWCVIWSAPE